MFMVVATLLRRAFGGSLCVVFAFKIWYDCGHLYKYIYTFFHTVVFILMNLYMICLLLTIDSLYVFIHISQALIQPISQFMHLASRNR